MSKIGIVTLCGNDNFGNKLQNYALKVILEEKKNDVYTIWIKNNFMSPWWKQILKQIRDMLKDRKLRNRKFIKFNKMLNIYNKKMIFNNDMKKISNNFDYFIVGSDQVWNPRYFDNPSTYFLLSSDKRKNISYAASFGISNLDKQYDEMYRNGLKNIKFISTREEQGKNIVQKITKRTDIEVLIDPTMLLTSQQWDKISKKPKKLKEGKYILSYFLGEISDERRREIERVAQENNCFIIDILDQKSPVYISGPEEFLYLEKNAFLICTDSFHSSVFAILFNKPFVIFDREQKDVEKMNSRLDTLISKLNLENREYNGKYITKENLNHDYSIAYEKLDIERSKAHCFLDIALKI